MSTSSAWPSVGLFTGTPSTSTWTWLGLAPRMLTAVVLPNEPDWRTSTPGTVRSASPMDV
jgi:hypothetical protein